MKQILQVDTGKLDALYLGADLKSISDVDTLQNKADEALLVAHSKYYPYKDVDCVESDSLGELLAKSGGILQAYPDRYKLKMIQNVYTGNISRHSPHYVYTAQRAGMYLVNCDISVHSTTYQDQTIGALFTNPVISSLSGMIGLWLVKNGADFSLPGIDSVGVWDTTNLVTDYKYDFFISKTWNVYLNAGDYIHFETNIYEVATPEPYTFYLWGTAKINYYGTKEEDTHAI